jgi:hypothetical protein
LVQWEINDKIGYTNWDWADDKQSIVVQINQQGQITITRGPDDQGRAGCDSPQQDG